MQLIILKYPILLFFLGLSLIMYSINEEDNLSVALGVIIIVLSIILFITTILNYKEMGLI